MMRGGPVLWIVPKWPFPAEDGARVATVQLLSHLTALGHEIDLLAMVGRGEKADVQEAKNRLRVREAFVVERPGSVLTGRNRAFKALFSVAGRPWMPVTFQPYGTSEIQKEVARILEGSGSGRYGAVVYDGLHPAAHGFKAGNSGKYQRPAGIGRVIYRAHNFETAIWERRCEQTRFPPLKIFLRWQARMVRGFEKSLLEACDSVAPVSEQDFGLLRGLRPGVRGRVVPIGYDFSSPLPPARDGMQLMFLGRLDWPPNREGLIWFLEKVWPEAVRRAPSLSLVVAGSGSSEGLEPLLRAERVRFLGRVERVEDLYRDSVLSLVPVFYGSGTRVKVIEASRFGRGCLSSALGVEGTGLQEGQSYLRAETAEEWIAALETLTRERAWQVGASAHERLSQVFDVGRTAREFSELFI